MEESGWERWTSGCSSRCGGLEAEPEIERRKARGRGRAGGEAEAEAEARRRRGGGGNREAEVEREPPSLRIIEGTMRRYGGEEVRFLMFIFLVLLFFVFFSLQ